MYFPSCYDKHMEMPLFTQETQVISSEIRLKFLNVNNAKNSRNYF